MSGRHRPLFVTALCATVVLSACSTNTDAASDPAEPENSAATTTTAASVEAAPDSTTAAPTTAPTTTTPPTTLAPPTDPPVPLAALGELGGEIALIDAEGRVVVTTPAGESARILSAPGTLNSQPTWSNAGDRVAWSSFQPDGSTLSVGASDGSGSTELETTSPAFYLSWSPDDSWIGGLRPTSVGMEMFISNAAATEDRPVSQAQPFYFDWENDDAIVAAVGSQLVADISASNAVDPLARPLADPLGAFQAPAVLPNGDVLVALRLDEQNSLVRLSGATPQVIATADAPMLFSVSPDGEQIAVLVAAAAGGQQGESQVIRFQFDEPIELETGRLTTIELTSGEAFTHPEEQVVSFSWSPDGTTLSKLSFAGAGLQWSFTTPVGERAGAQFVPTTALLQNYLPFFDQYNLSVTSWSPTSDAIVFTGSIGDDVGVFVDVIDDEFAPALVTNGEIAFWSPR